MWGIFYGSLRNMGLDGSAGRRSGPLIDREACPKVALLAQFERQTSLAQGNRYSSAVG